MILKVCKKERIKVIFFSCYRKRKVKALYVIIVRDTNSIGYITTLKSQNSLTETPQVYWQFKASVQVLKIFTFSKS